VIVNAETISEIPINTYIYEGEAMKKRCIMIFPKFQNLNRIQDIRQKYDPLFSKVNPHVTLVFPFTSDITEKELKEHIQNKAKYIKPFLLQLNGVSGEKDGYLFLNVKRGKEELVTLHNRLYEGMLCEYYPRFLETEIYKPHMTVGRVMNTEELRNVVEQYKDNYDIFEEIVSEISVELIDEDENSIIEMTVNIGSALRA
jgi:2'-5' RNA ligase